MYGRWGRVAILCDRASPHRTRILEEFARSCGGVEMLYIPKGSPYLNPVDECWHRGKRELLVSEYYETFAAMGSAVSQYYRTTGFRLDLSAYLYRSPSKILMNL